jgi:3D (Asp-Asp-Asp) domain-containing protein
LEANAELFICFKQACFWNLFLLAVCGAQAAESPRLNGRYTATAYSTPGETASGEHTQRHIVAADPDLLPIGSVIEITHAGAYSGEYVVADTGPKIVGRRLDIYIPDTRACKEFGRKRVRVHVVRLGDGTKQAAKQGINQVKHDEAPNTSGSAPRNSPPE